MQKITIFKAGSVSDEGINREKFLKELKNLQVLKLKLKKLEIVIKMRLKS